MVDSDENVDKKIAKMKDDATNLGYTKSIKIRKWNRDFESENFGIDMVLDKLNQSLSEKGYRVVEKKDVEIRMRTNGEALIKAMENIARKNNLDRFKNKSKNSSIISKPRLGELLIEDRLKEIQIDDEPEWNAKLPIEVELKEIFRLIPNYL